MYVPCRMAYLTGIPPIKKLKTQSALNNFMQYTMISPGALAPYTGFTEDEVALLCEKYGQDFTEVKRWYDGYRLGKYHIYNPNAVVNLMIEETFQSYWSQTGTFEAILPLINMDFDGLKTAVIEMLSGASVEVNTNSFQNDTTSFSSKDDVLTYLIHLGYLGYNQTARTAFIPNEEIRQELTIATRKSSWNELITFQQESTELLDATLDMDNDTVAAKILLIGISYDKKAKSINAPLSSIMQTASQIEMALQQNFPMPSSRRENPHDI